MKCSKQCMVFVSASLILSACASMPTGLPTSGFQPPMEGALKAAQIQTLFTDKTVTAIRIKDERSSRTFYHRWQVFYREQDGTVEKGEWNVRPDGRLCEWRGWDRKRCRAIVQVDPETVMQYRLRKNGDHRPILRYLAFEPGNRLEVKP